LKKGKKKIVKKDNTDEGRGVVTTRTATPRGEVTSPMKGERKKD